MAKPSDKPGLGRPRRRLVYLDELLPLFDRLQGDAETETDLADIRETAVADVSERQDPDQRYRVPSRSESDRAVERDQAGGRLQAG